MNPHKLTNVLLAIIAACLLVIAAGQLSLLPTAQAQSNKGNPPFACRQTAMGCEPASLVVDRNGALYVTTGR